MLITDPAIVNAQEVSLKIDQGATYTNAVRRSAYFRTSVHCPTVDITLQVSNVTTPNETNDTDWFTVGTGKFVTTNSPARWLRAKIAAPAATKHVCYILSADAKY